MRHTITAGMCTLLCGLTLPQSPAAQPNTQEAGASRGRRPNVLILFPDQLRWCSLGCYGDPVIRSPNIDQLAAEGVRFTHAFSNFPVCSPARSILLSGRYASANGVTRNQDGEAQPGRPTNQTTSLAEALSEAGYDTALVGKWHLAPTPKTLGFTASLRANMRHRYYRQTFRRNEGEPYVFDGYGPDHETEAAIDYIRRRRDKPFFLWVSYGPPHMPVSEMPDAYKKMYAPVTVPIRPNAITNGRLAYDETWFKTYLWDFQYYQNKDTFKESIPADMDLRGLTALYYGQITAIDDRVGQVLAALQETGQDHNTIVLLTSDHGDLLGSHGLFNKGRHYDEAIRVPLIIRYPAWLRPRVVNTQIASLVDVMPTLLDLCDVKAPETAQGVSLSRVLAGEIDSTGENAAFIETNREDGVRTLRYLYAVNRKPARAEQLFDLDKDPLELHNLVEDPTHQKTLESLRARVQEWRARTPTTITSR